MSATTTLPKRRMNKDKTYLFNKYGKKTIVNAASSVLNLIKNDKKNEIVKSSELRISNSEQFIEMSNPEQYRSIHCHDKECSLSHQILANCVIFLHTNNSNCNIPCELDGCRKEMHHYMNCPIWNCIPYTTTTMTTTTSTPYTTTTMTTTTSTQTTTVTDTTTTTTEMPFPPICPTFRTESILLYISFFLNILFVLIIIALVIYLYKKMYVRQSQNSNRTRRVSLLDNNDHYFSIGSNDANESNSENLPLLERNCRRNQNQASSSIPVNNSPTFENIALTPNSPLSMRNQVAEDQTEFRVRHGFSTYKSNANVVQEHTPLLLKQK